MGNKAVCTSSEDKATFTFSTSQAVRVGQNVTATNVFEADTSEFSTTRLVVQ